MLKLMHLYLNNISISLFHTIYLNNNSNSKLIEYYIFIYLKINMYLFHDLSYFKPN